MPAKPLIESTAIFRKCPDVRYRNVGGEGIVVRQTVGEVLVLSEVGARVLGLLDAAAPVRTLVETLVAEYEIDRATLQIDVIAYLHELVDAGIIESVTDRALPR